MKTLVSTKDLCKLFSCTPATIMHYRDLGMPYTKLSPRAFFYDQKEVEHWYFYYKTRKFMRVKHVSWKGGGAGVYED